MVMKMTSREEYERNVQVYAEKVYGYEVSDQDWQPFFDKEMYNCPHPQEETHYSGLDKARILAGYILLKGKEVLKWIVKFVVSIRTRFM